MTKFCGYYPFRSFNKKKARAKHRRAEALIWAHMHCNDITSHHIKNDTCYNLISSYDTPHDHFWPKTEFCFFSNVCCGLIWFIITSSFLLSHIGKELLVPLTSSVSFCLHWTVSVLLCCMMCFKLRHGYLELCMFVLDIPVTQMYVPGTLNDVEHVLVDVGTGYYVEKVKKINKFAIWKAMNGL